MEKKVNRRNLIVKIKVNNIAEIRCDNKVSHITPCITCRYVTQRIPISVRI